MGSCIFLIFMLYSCTVPLDKEQAYVNKRVDVHITFLEMPSEGKEEFSV
jgi:hypothetical protein